MHRNMEIRHMAFHMETLALILDTSEGWRDFLYMIPRNLNDLWKEEYALKYTGLNESILETESRKNNSSPAKLLLDEWGISGQVRPTVDHLLTLLIRAKQIRAAEYLTKLLNEKPPARPRDGPGAPIDVTLPEDHQTESLLNGISYPSSTILQNNVESVTIDNNRDYYDKMGPMKRVEIKENSSSIAEGELPVFSSSNNDTRSASDSSDIRNPQMLAKYPEQLPGPSNPRKATNDAMANETETDTMSSSKLPMISELGIDVNSDQPRELVESSKLQNNRNYEHINNGYDETNALRDQQEDIPALSALLDGSSNSQRNHSNSTNRTHDSIPMLSMLGSESSSSNTPESVSFVASEQIQNSVSNLIEFSASPVIAEYSYDLLHTATDGFDSNPFTSGNVHAPDGRSIGAGGFGTVFLALQLSSSIPVAAVKRLDPDKYKFQEKFQLELDILSNHFHTNVVRLLGCSRDGANLCLVYEYLKDGNLETALSLVRSNQRQLTSTIRLKYLHDIANAIAFLHDQAKVIHRDVKSANILLDGTVAKLCDFGLIKRTSSRTTTSIIGTNAYMAPEAVRGDVSPALDIFAFGIVIAEVVTGEPVLAEKESRTEIDLAGYIGRHRAEGRDMRSLVDMRAITEISERQWGEIGAKLLEIAVKCMGEKWSRPASNSLATAIGNVRLVSS